eukprot:gene22257-36727_t
MRAFGAVAAAAARARCAAWLRSVDAYEEFASEKDTGRAVVFFTAGWCSPCAQISPVAG